MILFIDQKKPYQLWEVPADGVIKTTGRPNVRIRNFKSIGAAVDAGKKSPPVFSMVYITYGNNLTLMSMVRQDRVTTSLTNGDDAIAS